MERSKCRQAQQKRVARHEEDGELRRQEKSRLATSPYYNYCVGYPGKGNYFVSLVMGIGSAKRSFSHNGSQALDSIVAFDRTEVSEAYIGQINVSYVSSFCGPQGLIWGYDVANAGIDQPPSLLSSTKIEEFKGVKIVSSEGVKRAATTLFGTNDERHFPFLPGSHVPCAGRTYTGTGPIILYAAAAIGIADNRWKDACLFMEDCGQIVGFDAILESVKEKLLLNTIRAVLEVGKNQKVAYKEILVDLVAREVKDGEIGCALVLMPYFLMARGAITEKLADQDLTEWSRSAKCNFLYNRPI